MTDSPKPAETAAVSSDALRIEVDGEERVFFPPDDVTVGRSVDADVRLSEAHSLASRDHLSFTWDDKGWVLRDLESSRGTFIDGRRVAKPERVRGAFHVLLGDPTAGTQIRVVTAGVHGNRRRLVRLVAGSAVVLALVLSGLALFASGGGEEGNSAADLARAREATVMVELLDEGMNRIGFRGSGVLVSEDGLVLTNAHIAFAESHALRRGAQARFPDAPLFAVGFASIDGGELDRFYVAEPIELHPFHDAALLRIVADGNGQPRFEIPFRSLPLGVSAELTTGDQVAQLGYPDVAGTLRVSVTRRDFQSFAPCTGAAEDACLADLDVGWINLSGQPLGGGSSGGPIVRDGRLVGINQGSVSEGSRNVEQNRAVPIDVIVAGLAITK